MTKFEEPVDFRDRLSADCPWAADSADHRTDNLARRALAYAVGFGILYPIAKMDVVKSVSTSAAPALMEVVGHRSDEAGAAVRR